MLGGTNSYVEEAKAHRWAGGDHADLMSALKNPRYERLAQALAQGKSQERAYVEAGYSAKSARANVSTLLKRNTSILERVHELLQARLIVEEEGFRAAVEQSKVDRVWIERQLVEIVERCMSPSPVLDHDGRPVSVETHDGGRAPMYAFNAAGALAALRLLGIERGMFTQRLQPAEGPLDRLPAAVLKQIRESLLNLRQGREPPSSSENPLNGADTASDLSGNGDHPFAGAPKCSDASFHPGTDRRAS